MSQGLGAGLRGQRAASLLVRYGTATCGRREVSYESLVPLNTIGVVAQHTAGKDAVRGQGPFPAPDTVKRTAVHHCT